MKKMYVQSILDFVEENIEATITMEDVATYIGYSKCYLHKLFNIYTGMDLIAYVRKRKLEYALQDLKGHAPIVDIAIKYGFNSSRSFSRAFLNVYGLSPGKYRHNTCVLTQKLELNEIGGIKMLPYLSDSKIVSVNKIYAFAHKVFSPTCEEDVIGFMTDYKLKHSLMVFTEVGFDVCLDEDVNQEGLRGYEYWLVVDEETYNKHEPEGPVVKISVEKSKYLMLTITEPFVDPWERIPNGWKKAWDQIEKHHDFKENFTVYGFEEKIDTLHGTFMNIYIPVK